MEWLSPGNVAGYAGTAVGLVNGGLIFWFQRTSHLYWALANLHNIIWLVAGWLLDSPAVMVDTAIFWPLAIAGWLRYYKQERS